MSSVYIWGIDVGFTELIQIQQASEFSVAQADSCTFVCVGCLCRWRVLLPLSLWQGGSYRRGPTAGGTSRAAPTFHNSSGSRHWTAVGQRR